MVKKILNIAFWVIFCIVFLIWLVDFLRVRAENNPIFCISRETVEIEGGTAEKCTGLGYRVIQYDSEVVGVGYEFGPFWIQVRGIPEES